MNSITSVERPDRYAVGPLFFGLGLWLLVFLIVAYGSLIGVVSIPLFFIALLCTAAALVVSLVGVLVCAVRQRWRRAASWLILPILVGATPLIGYVAVHVHLLTFKVGYERKIAQSTQPVGRRSLYLDDWSWGFVSNDPEFLYYDETDTIDKKQKNRCTRFSGHYFLCSSVLG